VAIDPTPGKKLAYVSYYAGGFRILQYDNNGLAEVGAFIDEGGNNFWGVEVHNIGKHQYVLASDRDFGLYIFQPDLDTAAFPRGGGRRGARRPHHDVTDLVAPETCYRR